MLQHIGSRLWLSTLERKCFVELVEQLFYELIVLRDHLAFDVHDYVGNFGGRFFPANLYLAFRTRLELRSLGA